ncbi:MAG TPA: adenylate/guanylate cyclase domain-containing protein [Flavisolibacter sp.]|nr:adenylate/guanylate cyclase domain-containing protein [Flavisolibacter sp.]
MGPRRIFLYRLKIVVYIALIWVFFSLLFKYNIIAVDSKLLLNRSISFFSLAFLIIGLIIAGAETFFLKKAFSRRPLWLSIPLRLALTFILLLVVSVFFLLLYFVFRYNGSFESFTALFIGDMVMTPSFLMLTIDLGLMSFMSILLLEIIDKYGPGGFTDMIRGRYNKPRVENRIFIFLDINDATTIAEKLGHEKYFGLLKEFFADITEPILVNGGEIYQYVGDEIVVSWQNTAANKTRCLRFIKQAVDSIKSKESHYRKVYGFYPDFKTGIHAGDVTAGYIGIIKKDLVYSGDTLNTTARIRSKCHELNQSYVFSGSFLEGFDIPPVYHSSEIGDIRLKGREEREKLFSLVLW